MRLTILMIAGVGVMFASLTCRTDEQTTIKPEPVPRIVYEVYPDEWYQQQAQLWQQEIRKDSADANAWYNYYNAVRYARFKTEQWQEKNQRLSTIIDQMGEHVADSYEYALLSYWNTSHFHDLDAIRKAYERAPERPDTYYAFIVHYIASGDEKKAREFCQKLYNSEDIAPWLLNYNYNVLMSIEPGGILFTNGDNDTYPVWILQHIKNIRPNAVILNVSLLPDKSYFINNLIERGFNIDYETIKEAAKSEGTFSRPRFVRETVEALRNEYDETPLYFGLTVAKDFTKPFSEQLFLVGLAYQYSPDRIDNLALLKRNLENRFRLDYLSLQFYQEDRLGKHLSARMQLNYIASMIMLAEHHALSDQHSRSDYWRQKALNLAENAGDQEIINKIKQTLPE